MNTTARTLTRFVSEAAEPGSTVYTDDYRAYRRLASLGYAHQAPLWPYLVPCAP